MSPLLSWIWSYLTDRFAVIRFTSAESEAFQVMTGVPQGSLSLLCNFLLSLFLKDISEVIESKILLFAADDNLFGHLVIATDCGYLQRCFDVVWRPYNKHIRHLAPWVLGSSSLCAILDAHIPIFLMNVFGHPTYSPHLTYT